MRTKGGTGRKGTASRTDRVRDVIHHDIDDDTTCIYLQLTFSDKELLGLLELKV